MIYLLAFYLFISLACFAAGLLLYTIISTGPYHSDTHDKPLIIYLLTGLMAITLTGQWMVLFLPLNGVSFFIIVLLLLSLLFIYRKGVWLRFRSVSQKFKQNRPLFFLCFGSLLFMILVINAGPVIMDDTDSYHIQMIKWAQEYGTVPGIANLHLRFGFNSSWFISTALLAPKIQGINTYLVLNGVLSAWFCYYLIGKITTMLNRRDGVNPVGLLPCFFLLLVCLASWPMIRGSAATANYDFIATCCIVVLFTEGFSAGTFKPTTEWIIWPVYLFTVRIINYPLLLVTLVAFIRLYRSGMARDCIRFAVLSLLFIIPFLARNVILSGYPFFPVYRVDLFSVDWKADKQQTRDILDYIKYFNRVSNANQPIATTMKYQFPGWTVPWYHFLFLYDKILVTLSFCSYLFMIVFWKKFKAIFTVDSKIFLVIMAVQLLSWFVVAPDPRFVYGPLLCGVFAVLVITRKFPFTIKYNTISKAVLLCISLTMVAYASVKIKSGDAYRNWIIPRALPVPPAREVSIDGIRLYIPEKILNNWNPRCYDAPLPCLYEVDPRLRARGKSINEGFRLEK